jgi:phenylpropionate dioxygenase-like ring-hydroxylating dioxygenase large terminal subunit
MTHTESDLDAAIEVEADPDDSTGVVPEDLSDPMTIPVEAYVSQEYARAERDKLWRKVWQQVGRVEEIPEVGSYLTYDVLDDSIIVVRTGPNEFAAHHNVCMHRGRKLVDNAEGAKNAVGRARKSFVCGFHGWTYGLDGTCTHIREQDDWQGKLSARNTHLAPVQVDTWGGWLFVNMDPDCESLADYLMPAAKILDPFGLENMRYKWRKWLYFDCNWKVALEAFNETYHVFTTHPEFNRFGEFKGWAKAQGRHSNIGYDAPKGMEETKSKIRLGTGDDPRVSTAEMQMYTWEQTNATTTETLVNAAKRLVDELPEGTPADKVLQHWLASARRDDEERGVIWPTIPPDILGQSGTAWQLFPNLQIGQGLTSALCYSARPDPSYDPNKCIFEVAVFELYPKGGEPQTEWQYTPKDSPNWLSVLPQDFSNMAAVQQGMKSAGFPGTMPNPYRERSTVNLHTQLAKYMGTGAPRELEGEA